MRRRSRRYPATTLPPESFTGMRGSGLGAGPATGAPVETLYIEPWHGQFSVGPGPGLTVQPLWVQIELNAFTVPARGRVTRACLPLIVAATQPPTGMSARATIFLPDGEDVAALDGALEAGLDVAAAVDFAVELLLP
ncbi:MAG: hypothetical protein ABJA87_08210 [bacterium]